MTRFELVGGGAAHRRSSCSWASVAGAVRRPHLRPCRTSCRGARMPATLNLDYSLLIPEFCSAALARAHHRARPVRAEGSARTAALRHGRRPDRRRSCCRSAWIEQGRQLRRPDLHRRLHDVLPLLLHRARPSSSCWRRRSSCRTQLRHPGEYYAPAPALDGRRDLHGRGARAADRLHLARAAELLPLHPGLATPRSTRAPTRPA